jgi:hypothetical protein
MGPDLDNTTLICDATTPDGGQVLQFDPDGLICHITDDSALFQYESDNESIHSHPFATPLIHLEEHEHHFVPDIDDYIVAHIGEHAPAGVTYEDSVTILETAHTAP